MGLGGGEGGAEMPVSKAIQSDQGKERREEESKKGERRKKDLLS